MFRPIPLLMLSLAAPATAGLGDPFMGLAVRSVTVRERVIVRVPLAPPPKPIVWKEKKGPKCIAVASLAGALVTKPQSIDLVLLGNKRVRAKLDGDCKPMAYYSGFYLRPAADGQVCAGRDAIRIRSGASCDIDDFKSLVAKK